MRKSRYKTVKTKDLPEGKHFLREHVLVAEKMLGRSLKPGECVHHIDGNKLNNNSNNLIVFASNADHVSHHKGAEIYKDGDVWKSKPQIKKLICDFCGKEFNSPKGKRIRKTTFCSNECYYKYMQKTEKTTEELVRELIIANGNFSYVAKQNKLSSNAIVKRLRKQGFPYHSKDYKQKTET